MAYTIIDFAFPKMPVQLTGSGIKKNYSYVTSGDLGAGGKKTAIDKQTPFRLDHLEWSCDSLNAVRVIIDPYQDGGTSFGITAGISTDGKDVLNSARPDNILDSFTAEWAILEFNEGSNQYKFKYNLSGLEFPHGVNIFLENTGGSTQQAAIKLIGSEL